MFHCSCLHVNHNLWFLKTCMISPLCLIKEMNFYDKHGFLQCVYFQRMNRSIVFLTAINKCVPYSKLKAWPSKNDFIYFGVKRNEHVTQYLRFSFKQWKIYYYFNYNIILRKIHFPKLYCYEMFTSEKESLDITILGNLPLWKKKELNSRNLGYVHSTVCICPFV